MVQLTLPVATLEDVTRLRAEYESASKHGYETRDAMIRYAYVLGSPIFWFRGIRHAFRSLLVAVGRCVTAEMRYGISLSSQAYLGASAQH
jgi:uncharacterized membrane protein YagU involved in acid resistance